MRFRLTAVVLLVGSLMPTLVFTQDVPKSQNIADPDYIYRLVYEQAIADSILTPEESAILETLRRGLGFEEELVESIIGDSNSPRPPGIDHSGRWTLMAQNMAWAGGLYGWGIPFVLDIDEARIITASAMFSLGGALYLTYKYTSRTAFPEARSQMQRQGGLIGLHTSLAINAVLDIEDKAAVTSVMLTVPFGIYLGDRLYHHWQPSTGQAYVLSIHAQFGQSIMNLLHRQFEREPYDPWDDDDRGDSENDQAIPEHEEWLETHQLYLVAGYPIGIYLGHKFYGRRRYSFGDAAMLTLGRATGTMYGLMISSIVDLNFDKLGWRYLATGCGLAGVVFMDRYIAGYDYRFGQAAIMSLGGVAGAAFGIGVGALIEADIRPQLALVMGSSAMGFIIIRKIIDPTPEYRAASTDDGTRVSLSVLPSISNGQIVPMGNLSLSW